MPKTLTRFESEATMYEAKMEWKVDRIREMIKRKESLDSPSFCCKKDPNQAVWSIQLDFGNREGHEQYLSFSCTNHSLARDIFVDKLSFRIYSKNKYRLVGRFFADDVTFGGTNSDQASKKYTTNAKLVDIASATEKTLFFPDGNLHVVCKVKYFGGVKTYQQRIGTIYRTNVTPKTSTTSASRVSKNEILSGIAKDFATLSTCESTADIFIVVGETKIPAHRCILMARSPVFRGD